MGTFEHTLIVLATVVVSFSAGYMLAELRSLRKYISDIISQKKLAMKHYSKALLTTGFALCLGTAHADPVLLSDTTGVEYFPYQLTSKDQLSSVLVVRHDYNCTERSDAVQLFTNDGKDNFTGTALATRTFHQGKSGDFNGDGALDVVLFSRCHTENAVVISTDSGYEFQLLPGVISSHGGEVVDWDSDGDLDILSVGEVFGTTTAWVMWHENQNGEFADPVKVAGEGFSPTSIAVVDFNNDGALDILAGGHGDGYALIRWTGTEWVPETTEKRTDFNGMHWLAGKDVDQDGDLDLVTVTGEIVGPWSNAMIDIYFNNNGFGEPQRITNGEYYESKHNGPYARGIELFDADSDGDLDLVVQATAKRLNWFGKGFPSVFLQEDGEFSGRLLETRSHMEYYHNGGSWHSPVPVQLARGTGVAYIVEMLPFDESRRGLSEGIYLEIEGFFEKRG